MNLTKTEDVDVTYLGERIETTKADIAQFDSRFALDPTYALGTIPIRIKYQTFSDGKGEIYNLKACDVPSELLKGQELCIEKRFLSLFGRGKIVIGKKLKAKN
jgi:hypothetical protein